MMYYKATWALAAASAAVYFACGSQPDWTDVQDELAYRKSLAATGGSDTTGGPTTPSGGSGDVNPATGSGGSDQPGAGGDVTPGTGGMPMGGAGTVVSTTDSGAGTP